MDLVDIAGRADHEDLLGEARASELLCVRDLGHAEGIHAGIAADGSQGNETQTVAVSLDDGQTGALFRRAF